MVEHTAKQLAWSWEYRSFTVHDWEGVIFSDECSVEQSPTSSQTWVFYLATEKLHRRCILTKKWRKEISLIVWSCFYGKTRGLLVAHLEKSANANVYLRILHRYHLPIFYKIQNTIGDLVFQQDNTPIHKAGSVMQFFEKYNIDLLTHPPYLLDLNPIENVWVLLKRQLLIDYPNIVNTPEGSPTVKTRFTQVLPRVWDNIPQKHFEALWKSMPAHVEAVIKAKGWYTWYKAKSFEAVARWECHVGIRVLTRGGGCWHTFLLHHNTL